MTEASGSYGGVVVSMRFGAPSAALVDLVTAYYVVEVSGPADTCVRDILHPEWGNLRFRLNSEWHVLDSRGEPIPPTASALFGPTSRARHVVARTGSVLGVGFTPLGWAQLIRRPARGLADQVADAVSAIEPGLSALQKRLRAVDCDAARYAMLDDFFEARIERQAGREALIRDIHRALLDPSIKTVEAFAAAAGVSQPVLARACLRDFGFTPKLLLRRQRFMRTLAALSIHEDQPIGEVLDAAYVDHSHFNRDFKRFMGMTPSAYLAEPRLMLRAATGERDRALGAALQGLHQLRRPRIDRPRASMGASPLS